jgi:peroxiredoxin Q/BCP
MMPHVDHSAPASLHFITLTSALVLASLTAGCDKAPAQAPAQAAATGADTAPVRARGPLSVGDPIPDVAATLADGSKLALASLKGAPLVVYFYPKDNTPGCTLQGQGLRDRWEDFRKAGARVIGVSSDDASSHRSFAEEHQLPFELAADTDFSLARAFSVPIVGGRSKRVTFIFDKEGTLRHHIPEVVPQDHAEQVLRLVASL